MIKEKKKYLVACSGGPDSMALLNMYKDKYELYCCHINYHKRDTAKRDENIVRKYCKNNNITFIKYDYIDNHQGNFQERARAYRYDCFKKCVDKYKLDGVLVGHHLDDLLETYIMQEKKHLTVAYYGISKNSFVNGVKVIRPLLKYSKNDLYKYCIKNNIKFGIDESNLSDAYERNRIRHSKIEKMSKEDKKELLKEINYKNYIQEEEKKIVRKYIKNRNKFDYEEFINCPYIKRVLRSLLCDSLSDKYLDEIIKALKSKHNVELLVHNKFIYKEYDYVEIKDKEDDYCFEYNDLSFIKEKHFKLSKKGTSFEGVTLKKEDFPITIRNYRNGDSILMRYGTKKINRFFIDEKIPTSQRKMWPIMLNKEGSAILVPGIGCDKFHYSTKHNMFMIKL